MKNIFGSLMNGRALKDPSRMVAPEPEDLSDALEKIQKANEAKAMMGQSPLAKAYFDTSGHAHDWAMRQVARMEKLAAKTGIELCPGDKEMWFDHYLTLYKATAPGNKYTFPVAPSGMGSGAAYRPVPSLGGSVIKYGLGPGDVLQWESGGRTYQFTTSLGYTQVLNPFTGAWEPAGAPKAALSKAMVTP